MSTGLYDKARIAVGTGRAAGIAIIGRMATGKDTVGDAASAAYDDRIGDSRNWTRYKIGNHLRTDVDRFRGMLHRDGPAAVAQYLGCHPEDPVLAGTLDAVSRMAESGLTAWDRGRDVRLALQGVSRLRHRSTPMWSAKLVFSDIVGMLAAGQFVLATDVRYPGEAAAAQAAGMCVFGLVADEDERIRRIARRDGFSPEPATVNHSSEQAVDRAMAYAESVYDTQTDTVRQMADNIAWRVAGRADRPQ